MTTQAAADRRLHPGTIALRFLKNLPQTLLGLPALLTVVSRSGWGNFLLIMLASILGFAAIHWLRWRNFRYGVGASEVVIESGLLQRSRRTIPFDRIQDVDFEQGPLHRLFGLAKVKIETGGQGKDEGALDSVTVAEAERLRAAIRAGRGQTAAPDENAETRAPLFAMGIGRVLYSGLFNFSLLWLAGIFALLQTLDNVLPFDVHDFGRWIGIVEDRVAGRVTAGAVLAVIGLAILLGLASGVISTVARDFGFRLTDEAGGLRRERGLLTRTAVLITKKRIQLALIEAGPIRRALGWYSLRFQTLGAGEAKREGGLQDAAPFARTAEIVPVLGAAGRLAMPDSAKLQRVSHSHVWKAVAKAVAWPIVPVTIATIVMPVLIVTALAIPLLVAVAIVERRFHRYALADGTIFIQTGFWRRRLWILPLAGIQTLTLERSWLQRRLDLTTIRFDTAGASHFAAPAIRDLRAPFAEALAAKIRA